MKCKLRQIGNSFGVILPKEAIKGYNIGDFIEIESVGAPSPVSRNDTVITKMEEKEKTSINVITDEEVDEAELVIDDDVKRTNEYHPN